MSEGDKVGNLVIDPEAPIESAAEDLLSRGEFSARLSSSLIDHTSGKATGVVIGLVGEWGSGKSSVLNLVEERIRDQYENVVVVRFNPWLISGRSDLLSQFFAELITTIGSDKKLKKRAKRLVKSLSKYGTHIASVAHFFHPVAGVAVGKTLDAAGKLVEETSLAVKRDELSEELSALDIPIVVMIDEVDRVEDDEVKTIAQLVRAVADFPNVSYLLAYDAHRVIEALGNGDFERGAAYLEKIVHIQIHLPVAFDEEIRELLSAELTRISASLGSAFFDPDLERYGDLLLKLIPEIITNARDVKRLSGTFQAIFGMVAGEVDWVDALGFCALQIKNPELISRLRLNPDMVVDDPVTFQESYLRSGREQKMELDEAIERFAGELSISRAQKDLLSSLFPSLNQGNFERDAPMDAIRFRRPLLALLRLGLPTGAVSRKEVLDFVALPEEEKVAYLRSCLEEDRLGAFLDRFSSVYYETSLDHLAVWRAIGIFLTRHANMMETRLVPMHEIDRTFSQLFLRIASTNEQLCDSAFEIVNTLNELGERTLVPNLVRHLFFTYGLFGRDERHDYLEYLSKEQTIELAEILSAQYRRELIADTLMPSIWSAQALFVLLDVGGFDEECRNHITHWTQVSNHLIGLTLLWFGANRILEPQLVDVMLDAQVYFDRINQELSEGGDNLENTARQALLKARENLGPYLANKSEGQANANDSEPSPE